MARQVTLVGAHIKLFINNKLYTPVQSVTFSVDYGETETYGIDADYPQEISTTKTAVRGSVSGFRTKLSGGLQAHDIRPLGKDVASSPYISIRIQDRSTGEDILFIENAKVSRETHSIPIKGVYSINFDFVGQKAFFALDRSSSGFGGLTF